MDLGNCPRSPRVVGGGCKGSFGPREQRSPKSLLHHPKPLLHWCNPISDQCNAGSKRPVAPSPIHFWRSSLFGQFPRSVASQGKVLLDEWLAVCLSGSQSNVIREAQLQEQLQARAGPPDLKPQTEVWRPTAQTSGLHWSLGSSYGRHFPERNGSDIFLGVGWKNVGRNFLGTSVLHLLCRMTHKFLPKFLRICNSMSCG